MVEDNKTLCGYIARQDTKYERNLYYTNFYVNKSLSIPEYRFRNFDNLNSDILICSICGYLITERIRDSYMGENHPFHFDGCPWKD